MARRKRDTNVTLRDSLAGIIHDEILGPRYLGYTSVSEFMHDSGRLLVLLLLLVKLLEDEPVKNEQLINVISTLRKKMQEMV